MGFLEYVYNIDLDVLGHGNTGVKHDYELSLLEVARDRLSSTRTPQDAREAVRELLVNLVGCQEFAAFEIDYGKAVMWPRWSFGVNAELQRPIDLIACPGLNPALQGRVTVFPNASQLEGVPLPVRALVPFDCDEERSGLLVLFHLLPQKNTLNDGDRTVLEVISMYAGRTLSGPSLVTQFGGR